MPEEAPEDYEWIVIFYWKSLLSRFFLRMYFSYGECLKHDASNLLIDKSQMQQRYWGHRQRGGQTDLVFFDWSDRVWNDSNESGYRATKGQQIRCLEGDSVSRQSRQARMLLSASAAFRQVPTPLLPYGSVTSINDFSEYVEFRKNYYIIFVIVTFGIDFEQNFCVSRKTPQTKTFISSWIKVCLSSFWIRLFVMRK